MMTFKQLRAEGTDIRVHGNGFVQINLPGYQRLHLFGAPDIPRQKSPTPAHDHRFGFTSRILSGALVNVDWCVSFDAVKRRDYPHTHYVCTFEPSAAGGEDTALIPHPERTCRLWVEHVAVMRAGGAYAIKPGAIHETFANEPTFTLMTKEPSEKIQPRVFCRIGREPDNSFTRYDLSPSDLWAIVEREYRSAFA